MRILYLNTDPGVPVLGRKGCSTHVREVCRALARRGHDVLCLTAWAGEDAVPGSAAVSELGFRLLELPPFRGRWMGNDFRRLLYNLRLRPVLAQVRRSFAPELVYERYALYATAGQIFAARENLPHLLEVNTTLADEQAKRLHMARLARRYEESLWRSARGLVAVSSPLGAQLRQRGIAGDGRLRVMPMAVDTGRFTPNATGPDKLAARHTPEGWTTILYAGALTHWHGIDTFYDIARAWREAGDKLRLVAVGGDERHLEEHRARAAEAGLGEYLEFAGSVDHREIPAWIASADIGFISRTSEFSSPTKMFEYMACGLPTVAPRQASIMEVLRHGDNGLLFEPEDTAAAVAALRQLAGDASLRQRLGAKARQDAVERHSWDRIASSIEEFHAALASGAQAELAVASPPAQPRSAAD